MTPLKELFSIDYRSLAAFRVLTAVTLLFVSVVWAPDLAEFFTDDGILTVAELERYFPAHRLTIFTVLTAPFFVYLSWLVLVVFSILLLAGYRSRLSATVCFLIYLSFVGRNPLLLQRGDTLLPLLLFWGIFLPIGKVFSVDGALDRDRDLSGSTTIFSVAAVGLLLQVLYVYVIGALLKTGYPWFPAGAAVYLALHLDSFVTSLGLALRDHVPLTIFLTYFVFFIELLSPFLLFFPDRHFRIRNLTLVLLIAMHLGFRLTLNIGHFWLASLSSLMAFVPARNWEWLRNKYWKPETRQIRIYYDRDCGFCLKTCLLLREFFLPFDVAIQPAQEHGEIGELLERENSWVVVTPANERLLHWQALSYVTAQSPLMRPFWLPVWLLGKVGLGKLIYRAVGDRRGRLGRLTSPLLPFRHDRFRLNLAGSVLLGLVMVVCFIWNVEERVPFDRRSAFTRAVMPLMDKAGFSQAWGMFAPFPSLVDGYPVVAVRLSGEKEMYWQDGGLAEVAVRPPHLEQTFKSYRWRKYFNRIAFYEKEPREALFHRYALLVCGQLKRSADYGDRVESVEIHFATNTSISEPEDQYTDVYLGTWMCE